MKTRLADSQTSYKFKEVNKFRNKNTRWFIFIIPKFLIAKLLVTTKQLLVWK